MLLKINYKKVFIPLFFIINQLISQTSFYTISDSTLVNEDVEKNKHLKTFLYDMENVFGGIAYAYSRPLNWENKQWNQFIVAIVGTTIIFSVDKPVSDYFISIEDNIPQVIQDYGWNYGNPENNYMLTGAVYLTALFTNNDKLRRTGVLLISSASSAGLIQHISKSVFGRARPRSGESNVTFKPLTDDKNFHSFPSGHMILSFTNSYAISKQFNNKWVKGGILFLGAIPGISRLWDGAHWFSDIFLSTAISIATVEAIDKYLDTKYDSKYVVKPNKVNFNLNIDLSSIGVTINF